MKLTSRYRLFLALFAGLLLAAFAVAARAEGAGVATIDGEPVSYDEFERMAYNEARQTFYHAAPTDEATYIAFRREVADKLVNRKLKLSEARRRGMEPDNEFVGLELARYEAQYSGTEQWETDGEAMLERLRVYFEEESLLDNVTRMEAALERWLPDGGKVQPIDWTSGVVHAMLRQQVLPCAAA